MKYFLIITLFLYSCLNTSQGDPKAIGNYKGDLKDGKREGVGKLISSEGTYTGEFMNDKVSGYGEFIGNDGGYYRGMWLNRQWHGVGKAKWPNGNNCIGEFKHENMHGFVAYTRYNGAQYIGYYENGIKTGIGKIIFTEPGRKGDLYIGEIKDNGINGHGKYYNADGSSLEGIFLSGDLINYKKFTIEDSMKIERRINYDFLRVIEELSKNEKKFKEKLKV